MKKKNKKILLIICCFVMFVGSCLSVNAAKISSYKHSPGDNTNVYFGFTFIKNGSTYYNTRLVEIKNIQSTDEVRIIWAEDSGSTSSLNYYPILVSKNSFKYSYAYSSDSSENAIDYSSLIGTNTSFSNGSSMKCTYNGVNYYWSSPNITLSGNPRIFNIVSISQPALPIVDYLGSSLSDSNRGLLFEKMYLADFTWDDGLGPTEPNLNEGSMNTSLGYLSNITYAQYIEKNSEGFPVNAKYVVGWDNNHSDWDDSYRVAHYIKVRADIKTLGNSTKSMYSDMIFVDDVSFSSVKSSFLNSDLTSTDEYNSFISEVKEQSNVLTDFPYTTGYIHYLIIYHENDNGIQYGYWNQITSDDFENSSIGKVPGYGIIDNDGNYVEIEDFGRLEDYEIGVGDSIEDAENNKETVTPNFDVLPSIKNIDDFMQYFQEMMASLFETIGSLPKYVAEFFSFLPAPIIVCLTMGVLIAIILRIVGR